MARHHVKIIAEFDRYIEADTLEAAQKQALGRFRAATDSTGMSSGFAEAYDGMNPNVAEALEELADRLESC